MSLAVTHLNGFGAKQAAAASAGPLVTTYKAFSSSGTTSPVTWSLDIGTAASDRYIVVCIAGLRSSAGSISSVTANGTSLTQIRTASEAANYTGEIWGGLVTAGSGAQNVVATFTGGWFSVGAATFTVTGSSTTSSSANGADTDNSNPLTASVNVNASGCLIGVCGNNSGSAVTWTGPTEQLDTTDSGGRRFSVASADYATAQTPLSVSVTGTGTSILVAAALTP